jgi:hypothetical protein
VVYSALRTGVCAGLLVVSGELCSADGPALVEAIDNEGKSTQGALTATDGGRLAIEVAGKPFAVDHFARVRFPSADAPPLLRPLLHRVTLRDRQTTLGELLGVDRERLHLRTTWAEKLFIPRGAVERITYAPGWPPVVIEEFEQSPAGWALTGAEVIKGEATSGQQSLTMTKGGQSARFHAAKPLADGRAAIRFLLPRQLPTDTWSAEWIFGQGEAARTVRIEFAGTGKDYRCSAPGRADYRGDIPRSAGWHRLEVEFTSHRLLVLIDDYVLWSGPRKAAPEPLAECRIACEAPADKAVTAAVRFDDFVVSRPFAEPKPTEPGDFTQDDVVSLDGDETCGPIVELASLRIVQEGRADKQVHDWRSVREVLFRRGALVEQESNGDHVRLRLRAGGGQREEIEGAVVALDGDRLNLTHPFLGELTIPIARIDELRPLFRGRRIPIESSPRHLGRGMKGGFALAKGEGNTLRWQVKLDTPTSAVLVIEVAHVAGEEDGPDVKAALRRGGLRAEVSVNGRRIDHLNRHVDRSTWESVWARIPVPSEMLNAGTNIVELRQTTDRETGRSGDCEVRGIRLEIPERR